MQDETVLIMWQLKERLGSNVTPRSFADWTGISSLPINDRRKSGTLEIIWRLPNTMSFFVLDALRR